MEKEKNACGIVALVCGIVSIVLFMFCMSNYVLGFFLSIIGIGLGITAIACGSKGKKKIVYRKMSKAGFVCGIVGVVFCSIAFLGNGLSLIPSSEASNEFYNSINNAINDSENDSKKISIDLYGRAIEQAIRNESMKFSGNLECTDYENIVANLNYSGAKVECDVTINEDETVYLSNCTVNGKYINYTYGNSTKEGICYIKQ